MIDEAESEARFILSERGHLTGLPQASHTLSEAIQIVQRVQRMLTLMRGIGEHPTPHQDQGAPPGAEEPLGSDDSKDKGDA